LGVDAGEGLGGLIGKDGGLGGHFGYRVERRRGSGSGGQLEEKFPRGEGSLSTELWKYIPHPSHAKRK
jgi:hypothetical protein